MLFQSIPADENLNCLPCETDTVKLMWKFWTGINFCNFRDCSQIHWRGKIKPFPSSTQFYDVCQEKLQKITKNYSLWQVDDCTHCLRRTNRYNPVQQSCIFSVICLIGLVCFEDLYSFNIISVILWLRARRYLISGIEVVRPVLKLQTPCSAIYELNNFYLFVIFNNPIKKKFERT